MRKLWSPAAVALVAGFLSGCTFMKMVRHGVADVDDHLIFPYREIKASESPRPFGDLGFRGDHFSGWALDWKSRQELARFLTDNDTLAFLVIHKGVLVYEGYYNGHAVDRVSMAFSMTKSFLSLLIGCAIDDGLIGSVDQPVTDFVPELSAKGFEAVKLLHLLQMTSGMDYLESNNPFGQHPHFYYGDDLEERLLDQQLDQPPGTSYRYKSGENQMLGLILQRALGRRTISDYLGERIWDPVGMEFDAKWSIDREPGGLEKTFCCLAATARDVAKFGRLVLEQGRAGERQVISSAWLAASTQVDTRNGSASFYQYQWWLPFEGSRVVMAVGHRGQFLYVNPDLDLIVVRLGISTGDLSHGEWRAFLYAIEERFGLRPPVEGEAHPVDRILTGS